MILLYHVHAIYGTHKVHVITFWDMQYVLPKDHEYRYVAPCASVHVNRIAMQT